MGQHALLPNPNMTKRTLKKQGDFLVSLQKRKTKIPLAPKMILKLSSKMTTLGFPTQKIWRKAKDCAKQRKRKMPHQKWILFKK